MPSHTQEERRKKRKNRGVLTISIRMRKAKAARGGSKHNTGHRFEDKVRKIASRPGFKARTKGQSRMDAARRVAGKLKSEGKIN